MPVGKEKSKSTHHADPFTYKAGSKPLDGYTIKRGVGHGGFGEVYYATSEAGKEVALKLIRRSLDVELRGIKHCLNLKHQNLLDIYDIRQDEKGDHWVVMEYISNECLDRIMDQHPKGLPAEEALQWFHGIAAGVAYLHNHGIVHRDLKPGNVFSEDGRVAIGDYGLSKFISCSRRSGHTESIGTIHYMAPEVANGRYGKEIDIYALGIILYELLTGHVPFEGESVGEVLMKHLTALPDVSMLADPYRSVVLKALEKDPEKRFSSVEEMVAKLPRLKGQHIETVIMADVIGDSQPGQNGKKRREFHPKNLHKKHLKRHEPVPVARIKSPREISTELVGSMLIVLPVVGVMAIVMSILTRLSFERCAPDQCAWMVLVSIVGAWAILVSSKSWEGFQSHGVPQRFVTLGIGLLIGLFAYGVAEVFQLQLLHNPDFPMGPDLTQSLGFAADHVAGLSWHVWLAAFATLFFVTRWSHQATLHRRKRLSLGVLLKVGIIGGVTAWFWRFPQPWLIMVAVTTSTAIQVAAPWERKRKRS